MLQYIQRYRPQLIVLLMAILSGCSDDQTTESKGNDQGSLRLDASTPATLRATLDEMKEAQKDKPYERSADLLTATQMILFAQIRNLDPDRIMPDADSDRIKTLAELSDDDVHWLMGEIVDDMTDEEVIAISKQFVGAWDNQ